MRSQWITLSLCTVLGTASGCEHDGREHSSEAAITEVSQASGPAETPLVVEQNENEQNTDQDPEQEDSEVVKLLDSAGAISIFVTPYYDSQTMSLEVGVWSDALGKADRDSIRQVAAKMIRQWDRLPFETMYVVAIRLFDLGWRDEAVFWFYSAQYRGRLYSAVTQDTDKSIGTPEWERRQANNSFFQLVGPYINTWAFSRPRTSRAILKRVHADSQKLPPFEKIYPADRFIDRSKWDKQNTEIAEGLQKLIPLVQRRAADELPSKLPSKVGSPLLTALEAGDREQFRKLLDEGADPNAPNDSGDPIMHAAAAKRDSFWLATLLAHGGDADLPRGRGFLRTRPPLYHAIAHHRTENVRKLIQAGANVNYINGFHMSLLLHATMMQAFGIAELLMDAGADPTPPATSFSWIVGKNCIFDPTREPTFRKPSDFPDRDAFPSIEEQKRGYYRLKQRLIDMGHLKIVDKGKKETEKN